MADGQRYRSNLLEGFLNGRSDLALGYIADHLAGRAVLSKKELDAWKAAVLHANHALSEYRDNGDSEKVKELTGLMMDATDTAISLRNA